MSEPVLVILAAGIGSRYSKQEGLKQVDPVGLCGEKIIDYSLYDAWRAGFRRAVFIINEKHLSLFQQEIFPQLEKRLQVDYVFQKLEDVPEGYTVPQGRTKPWGTGHAALTAARTLGDAPYAVINADDFYGREAYEKMYRFLKSTRDGAKSQFAMVGFYLQNTLTENGAVNRGVCTVKDGRLLSVTETKNIQRRKDGSIAYPSEDGSAWTTLAPDMVVSMNLFGFTSSFTPALERDFERLFREDVQENPQKAELFLPFVVNGLIARGEAEVSVLSSADRWYGVTYRDDRESVSAAISRMTAEGKYPSPLWR